MTKNLRKFILAAAFSAALLIGYGARAQVSDVYPVVDGAGTAGMSASTTNAIVTSTGTATYNSPAGRNSAANTNLLTVNVSEYDYAGLTWAFTGTATSTNSLLLYPSYDKGRTFAKVPIWQDLNVAPGAADFITNAAIDVHGVTTLALVNYSSGTTAQTNLLEEINLKSPKYGAKAATR